MQQYTILNNDDDDDDDGTDYKIIWLLLLIQ